MESKVLKVGRGLLALVFKGPKVMLGRMEFRAIKVGRESSALELRELKDPVVLDLRVLLA
jgi:hypothetical protein